MKLRDNLRKLLDTNALLDYGNNQISIKGGKGNNKYSFCLTMIGHKDVGFINLGEGPHSSLISETGDYKKICDYLIFLPKNNEIAVLFCELKKTYNSSGCPQLHSSIPILSYLQSMLKTHFNEKRQFSYHFLILATKYHPRFDKQPTRSKPIFDTDFKGLKIKVIVSESIPFSTMWS